MRIAYFVDNFPLISETFVLEQVTGMIDRGHDVTLFANRLKPAGVRHPVVDRYRLMDRVVELPHVSRNRMRRVVQALSSVGELSRSGSLIRGLGALDVRKFGRRALGLGLLIRAAPCFGQGPFDVLHCQFGQLAVRTVPLRQCGALDGVLVTSFRGADVSRYAARNPAGFADLFRVGDAFLAVSDSVREQLVSLGCPPGRIRVLRSGVDLARFEYRGFRERHDPLRLLTIARLAPKKGIAFGLKAVRELVDAGRRVEYRVVGDGPLRDELRQLVADLDLADIVTFEGAVDSDRIVRLLDESDLLIAPSVRGPDGDEEGVPNSLKEAMATGLPCIGTDSGGTGELIRNGENGFIVPEGDAAAIANRIGKLMDAWDTLESVVENARRTIEDEYDIVRLNDVLEETYRELASAA